MKNSNYDLEERTLDFATKVRSFLKGLRKDFSLQNDIQQLIRSSGSVGANYIEANESLGRKDFLMRIRICLKETKESTYWLKLLKRSGSSDNQAINELIKESIELKNIFARIVQTTNEKLKPNKKVH